MFSHLLIIKFVTSDNIESRIEFQLSELLIVNSDAPVILFASSASENSSLSNVSSSSNILSLIYSLADAIDRL